MLLKIVILVLIGEALSQYDTHQLPDRSTIVHLFEWKWLDIAAECERFLAPKGYGGVQISPPSENLIIHYEPNSRLRTWYERYQVMSYKLKTRSGDRRDFLNMTRRCNDVGVRIYADVVINHMTGDNSENYGTGGNSANFIEYSYPGVPYTRDHFHYPACAINDYNDASQVRNCELVGLKDLNQTERYVRHKIVKFLNKLIRLGVAGFRYCDQVRECETKGRRDLNQRSQYVKDMIVHYMNLLIALGVAGFRIDAAKHMWPQDLKEIYDRLDDLSPAFGFPHKSRPYIYQEVIYYGKEAIKPKEYFPLGVVTEFRVGSTLTKMFRGTDSIKWLENWGSGWRLIPSVAALVFIDNHDTQRDSDVLTHKEPRAYKGAIAFLLAHPYGEPRIMSSYHFNNSQQGPPSDATENIISPTINKTDETCGKGWVCEHRWPQIYSMVSFRNAVRNTNLSSWWDNTNKQIAFSRGDKGFIVFNLEENILERVFQTGLPGGRYCDVISGTRKGAGCTGRNVTVSDDGLSSIELEGNAEHTHLAIHVGPESFLGPCTRKTHQSVLV